MKKPLSFLLAAALLLGLAVPAFAAAPDGFADSVAGQAFAAAMASQELSRYDPLPPADELFAAEAAGWYAAWLWRTRDQDLLTAQEVLDFERALGCAPEQAVPDYWEDVTVRVLRGGDGTEYLDFAAHKQRLEDTLGQTMEMRIGEAGEDAVRLTLIRRLSAGYTASYAYDLRFAPNPDADSAFAWQLTELTPPPRGAQLDPALTFDWDLLLSQNELDTLLEIYDCIRVENEFAPDMPTWFFRRDGRALSFTGDEAVYLSGEYRGCVFVREADEKGVLHTRVSFINDDPEAETYNNNWLTGWLDGIAVLTLEKIEDGVIRAGGVTDWDTALTLELDYGTLALRKLSYYSEDGQRMGGVEVHYDAALPEFSFLKSWDEPLRKVTVVREDWTSGARDLSTTVYKLPADWEYLPWEGRFGEYTIYMNEGYTQPYAYPGDGADYTLYMTTAKG